jgi:hypothetical protein
MPSFVQLYKSTDTSAPSLTGQVNSVVALLNAILLNGYSTAALTSIARGGTGNLIALAKMTSANATLVSGNYVKITGATGTGSGQYNTTAQIACAAAWVASTAYSEGALVTNDSAKVYVCRTTGTSAGSGGPTGTGSAISDGSCTWDYVDAAGTATQYFTYHVASDPGANASGSPVYCKAPLNGWTSPYTSTNAAVYRPGSGTQFYLQVIDNAATAGAGKEAQAMGFETMSAFNTGTGQYPTVAQAANGLCWRKSTTADGTARAWTLIGDDKGFYLFMNDAGTTATTNACCFGDFQSYKSGDAYNSCICGTTTFNTASPASGLMLGNTMSATTGSNGCYVPRAYTQTGSAVNCWMLGPTNSNVVHANTGGITYPNGSDSGLYCDPIILMEPTGTQSVRGRMRGLFAACHNTPLANYDQATSVQGLTGVTLTNVLSHSSGTAGQVLFDTFGAW